MPESVLTVVILLSASGAAALFVLIGFQIFTSGWQSYEEKYVQGAGRTLDAMYLTLPLQHLIYLSFTSMVLVGVLVGLVFGSVAWGVIVGIFGFAVPTLTIKRRPDSIFDYRFEDFEITGYQSHPAIKAPIAV